MLYCQMSYCPVESKPACRPPTDSGLYCKIHIMMVNYSSVFKFGGF